MENYELILSYIQKYMKKNRIFSVKEKNSHNISLNITYL
jgi:hypothetical protein